MIDLINYSIELLYMCIASSSPAIYVTSFKLTDSPYHLCIVNLYSLNKHSSTSALD